MKASVKKWINITGGLLLALVIFAGIFSEPVSAEPDPGNDPGSILITGAAANDIFCGYKILDITKDSDTGVRYEWVSEVEDLLKEANGGTVIPAETFVRMDEREQNKILSAILYSLTGEPDLAETNTSSSGNVQWENVDFGAYVIMPTQTTEVYQMMLAVVAPWFDPKTDDYITVSSEIEAKKRTVGISKKVNSPTTGRSEVLTYTITSDVPVYAEGTKDRYYAIGDKGDEALEIDLDSIRITGYISRENAENGVDGLELGTLKECRIEGLYQSCQKTENQEEEQDFAVEFDYGRIPRDIKVIQIVYEAKLAAWAKVGEDGLHNIAEMEYSAYPFIEDDEMHFRKNADADELVYTYELSIVKTDTENENVMLPGAEFDIYRRANTDERESVVTKNEVPQLGDGSFVFVGHLGPTDEKGEASIQNLNLGTYYLVETAAPVGYTPMSTAEEIVLSEEMGMNIEMRKQTIRVKNAQNVDPPESTEEEPVFWLPITGDTGTLVFTLAGVLIMIAAIILFYRSGKREGKEE